MAKSDMPGLDTPETRPPFVGPSERRAPPTPPPLPTDRRLGVAVVGLGRLSLDAILPALAATRFCRLAAVMSADREKGRRIAGQYGAPAQAVYGYEEWDRLGANPDVAFVYIVTPNGLHLSQVREAARVRKPVLCEKPMATSSQEAEAMIEACARAIIPLMIAYRSQYEPYNREAIRLTRAKTFGALKLIEAHNSQVQDVAPQWRHDAKLAGGGALPDIGIYCLSFARFVTGEEPTQVIAWSWSTPGDPRFAEVEENVAWQMRFPSGVVARLAAAYDAHEARPARMYFQQANVSLEPAFAYKGLRMRVNRRSPEREDVEIHEERVLEQKNQFAAEMDHMAECVTTGRKPRTPGEEGLQDHRIMEAIYQSARENRPVSLPLIEGLDRFRGPALEE